jgi:uncharacterized protein
LCRFNGHVKKFYSVAEHSWWVAKKVPPRLTLAALLHDASEAYICDIPAPVKPFLENYKDIEYVLMENIHRRFFLALNEEEEKVIKNVDRALCYTEARQLLPERTKEWDDEFVAKPYTDITLKCWSPAMAERQFIKLFNKEFKEYAANEN